MSLGWLHPSRWSVRTRSAVAAAVVVTICLAIAGAVLLLVLFRSLEHSAQDAAAARATQIAGQLHGESPDRLDQSLLATDSQIGAVQVVDGQGRVLAGSNGAPDIALVPGALSPGEARDLGRVKGPDGAFDYWMSGLGTTSVGVPATVLVGADREPVESVAEKVGGLLLLGSPVVIALVVFGTYSLVGAALRPVEAIRTRVASISGPDLGRRVPVPPSHDEIAQLATTMNAMLARIEAGQLAQQRFVSDASHELRSPLTTISAALELAQGRPDLVDAPLIDESLLPETRRMQHLVEDLLLLARSDEEGLEFQRVDVDLDDLLYGEEVRLRGIGSLRTVSRIAPCRVTGDRAALHRVVRNLVDNAARYARSTVTLDCHGIAGDAVVTVSDDGPGIDPADRERVFERFVRLDPTRTRSSGGTGLGLAIVEQIVRSHHGTVTVGESDDGGAVFTVTLPLALPDSGGPDDQPSSTSR
ncbi:ATP-binding protein [Rhodococcus sp. NPDC127528]|uniref:sensor histidine kinase n=1 Tax=unclassified Rhodococcus (in: high G+C Gram-positive bacteria) TaxID=192944 RepID=UPI00362BA798